MGEPHQGNDKGKGKVAEKYKIWGQKRVMSC